jgi:hypothetical protein
MGKLHGLFTPLQCFISAQTRTHHHLAYVENLWRSKGTMTTFMSSTINKDSETLLMGHGCDKCQVLGPSVGIGNAWQRHPWEDSAIGLTWREAVAHLEGWEVWRWINMHLVDVLGLGESWW